jgi:hypothetical protein
LIVFLLLGAGAACSETTRHVSSHFDSDADADVSDDAGPEVPDGLPLNTDCPEICTFLWECFGGLGPSLCGGMCARFKQEARDCIMDAVAMRDCYALESCGPHPMSPEYPEDCQDTCDFLYRDCVGDSFCYLYCPLYTGDAIWCGALATDEGICYDAMQCMMGNDFGNTCDQACDMADSECGLAVDPAGCLEACLALTSDGVSDSCIDVAVHFEDCEALASCGGLVP